MQATQTMSALPATSRTEAAAQTMHAMVQRRYGTPDVLTYEQVARPVPGDDQVLVRVHAATANIGDHHIVTGKPYLIRLSPFGGLPRPRNPVPGATFAGVVEAVGAKVTTSRVGDEVMGQAATGAFAEYVALPAAHVAPKPTNLSFDEAAAVPWAATALQGLRAANLKAGQKVLVYGASGAVGTWAVQIAKALGAHVTAVCSTRNVARVRALGADEVIDYTNEDFVKGGRRFDVMLDLVANRSLSECRSVIVKSGTYVPVAGTNGDWLGPLPRMIAMLVMSLFTSQKVAMFVMAPKQADLLFLKELVETGKAKPTIERRYSLAELGDALAHVGQGHSQGQTVIQIAR